MAELDHKVSLAKFDRAFTAHVYFVIRNFARSLFHGLTGGRLILVPGNSVTRRYYQKLTRMSSAFAFVADMALMTLGGSLKRREKLSGRLGDVLSELYLASAVLKKFKDDGCPKEDIPLLRWSCDTSLYNIQTALDGFLKNMPYRPVMYVIRWLVFPWGRCFAQPTDKLGHQVADIIMNPSATRDRLTVGMYAPTGMDEPIGRLEDAFIKVVKAEPIEKRLRKALRGFDPGIGGMDSLIDKAVADGIISKDEATIMRDAETARSDVIQVDDFPFDLGKEA